MNWVWKCHFRDPVFNSFGFTASSVITGSWGGSIFNFWGNLYHFPKQLHYFVFLLIMQKVPISPHSCPNWLFAPTPFFDHGRPYLTGFDVFFCEDQWCWPSFHVLVGHLPIIFGETSIQICCLLFVFFFKSGCSILLLRCRSFYKFWLLPHIRCTTADVFPILCSFHHSLRRI